VFIVHGGPGTGKSVIAVRLLAEVLNSKRLGFFVAPNKAFRDTLVEQLTKRHHKYREDGEALFKSSWSFHTADFMKDKTHEVLIVD
jgi:KaiC/GvpD/RAD55 family RecA-like ATPase